MGQNGTLMYSEAIRRRIEAGLPKINRLTTREHRLLDELTAKVAGNDDRQVEVTWDKWDAYTKALDARSGG